jgi:hypothetical protein
MSIRPLRVGQSMSYMEHTYTLLQQSLGGSGRQQIKERLNTLRETDGGRTLGTAVLLLAHI